MTDIKKNNDTSSSPSTTDHLKEPTVSKLLTHLQEMRELVPVNLQLKQDLKKELLNRIQQMNLSMDQALAEAPPRKISGRGCLLASILVVLSLIFAQWWPSNIEMQVMDSELFPSAEAALSPDGKQIAVIDEGLLNIIDAEQKDILSRTVAMPNKPGKANSSWANPTWSPDGQMIAVTEHDANQSRIWLVSTGTESSRLLIEENGITFGGMAWSPDLQWLMATRIGDGQEELIKVNVTNSVITEWGLGSQPAWSSNGSTVAFERGGEVILSSLDGTVEKNLGAGRYPVWSEESALYFITMDPLRITYSDSIISDLDRLEFNSIEIPFGSNETLSKVSLSADGNRLLWIESLENNERTVYRAEINR
jgi:TolB protein